MMNRTAVFVAGSIIVLLLEISIGEFLFPTGFGVATPNASRHTARSAAEVAHVTLDKRVGDFMADTIFAPDSVTRSALFIHQPAQRLATSESTAANTLSDVRAAAVFSSALEKA